MTANDKSYKDYADTCAQIYPPDDFEGLLIKRWSNGQLKFRGYFDKGRMRQGQHLLFWESGILEEVSHWKDGWAVGTLLRYRENGSKEEEIQYGSNGGRLQEYTCWSYRSSNEPLCVKELRNYESAWMWMDPEFASNWESFGGDNRIKELWNEMMGEDEVE